MSKNMGKNNDNKNKAIAVSTPFDPSESRKRDLTSPLDEQQAKKQLIHEFISSDSKDDESNPISEVDMTETFQSTSASSADQMAITLSEDNLKSIAGILQSSFRNEVKEMVKAIVDGVSSGLEARINVLETSNAKLIRENDSLKAQVEKLSLHCDNNEQYSRRNSLRITGIPEKDENENTDETVLNICSDLSVPVTTKDIDRSHRVGGGRDKNKPRAIIVKFVSYRARQILYKARLNLRYSGHPKVFVNEDLTKRRNSLLYQARQLVKSRKLLGAWSSDGSILVKDKHNRKHLITREEDLSAFDN